MELRLLGTTELVVDGAVQVLSAPMWRAVLADLALSAGQTLATSRLIDDLWGESPPATATHTVQAYVSRLRSVLNAGAKPVLLTSGSGYRLDLGRSQVDALRFSDLVAEAGDAVSRGDAACGAELVSSALSLWRGRPLADMGDAAFAPFAAARLDNDRVVALETLFDARLQLGHDRELVSELEMVIVDNPFREHLQAQLMTALYRSGRQAEALAVFQRTRKRLVDELGVEPGRELREIERAVLEQAPALELARGQRRDHLVASPVADPGPPRASANAVTSHLAARRPGGARVLGPRQALRWGVVGVVVVFIVALGAWKLSSGPHVPMDPAPVGISELTAATGTITGSSSLPSEPGSVASGDGSVWVSSPVSGILYRVDPATAAVMATIVVGTGAGAVAVAGPDVWVANTITGSLSEVSSATDEVVKTFVAGSEPTGLAVGYGFLWVADASASSLAALNTASDQVTTYPLTAPPFGIAVGAGSVWLSSPRDDNVTRFSTQGGPPVEVPVGAGPTAVAFGLGSVWVTNGLDNTVSRINPGTDSVVATIPVGDTPDALAVAGGSVWVANRLSSTLTRIDPSTDSAVRSVAIGGGPIALTALGRWIWTATATPASSAQSGGTLRIVSSVPTQSIDPALAYTQEPFQFLEGTYDTLVTFQRVGGSDGLQLVPDLALTMPTVTDGATTYSFVLRAGLRYSDGQPIRPEDFRHGIERSIELNQNAASFLSGIVGAASCVSGQPCNLSAGIVVSARADAITFHLTAPDANFLYQLAFQFTAPVPSFVPDHDVGTHPVPSTGPYMIGHYVPGHEVVFVRNPYFREWSAAAEPAGPPDRIVWTFGEPVSQEIAEIKAGTADATNDFIPDVGALAAQFPGRVHVNPALSIDYVAFNTRVAPFNDVRVRQAFSLAANRADLTDMLGGPDAASPSCQILPPGIPGYSQYCPFTVDPSPGGGWVGPDLAAARKLVAESGTRGMRVVFWSPPGAGPTSAFAVSVLRELGYRTSMVTPSFNAYFQIVNDSRRRAQVTDGSWYVDYPSASDLFDQFFRCSAWKLADPSAVRNGSFFCEPGLDHLMDIADDEELTHPTQAEATWAAVDRGVTDAEPWVVLVNLTEIDFLSSRVTNYQYNPALNGALLDQLEIRQR